MRTPVFLTAIALAAFPLAAHAVDPEIARHPAYVDGSSILDLAGEDGDLVEVRLGPALIDAVRAGVRSDEEASSVLAGLRGIYAYVVGLDHDPAKEDKARGKMKAIEAKLSSSGWERIVRVREKGDNVNVFTRPRGGRAKGDEQIVSGLVVLVLEKDDSQVVFVNIVGDIDMAKLGELSDTVKVPELKELAGESK